MILIAYLFIALCVIIRKVFQEEEGWARVGWGLLYCLPVAFFGSILTLTVNMIYPAFTEPVIESHVVRPIVSLRNNQTTNGSFILGCGSVGSYEQYYFMYDLGDGRYKRGNIGVHSTILREFDGEKPNISYDIMMDGISPKLAFWWPKSLTFEWRTYGNHVITIPKGTVIQKFVVD